MKSVKRVFKKRLPPYNLRSRGPALTVVRSSTPKVNREVQASLSEEDNFALLRELPYYNSSSFQVSAHATNPRTISESIVHIQSEDQPRSSTAFSSPHQADITTREAIDISIDPSTSIVNQPIVKTSLSNNILPVNCEKGAKAVHSKIFRRSNPVDFRQDLASL